MPISLDDPKLKPVIDSTLQELGVSSIEEVDDDALPIFAEVIRKRAASMVEDKSTEIRPSRVGSSTPMDRGAVELIKQYGKPALDVVGKKAVAVAEGIREAMEGLEAGGKNVVSQMRGAASVGLSPSLGLNEEQLQAIGGESPDLGPLQGLYPLLGAASGILTAPYHIGISVGDVEAYKKRVNTALDMMKSDDFLSKIGGAVGYISAPVTHLFHSILPNYAGLADVPVFSDEWFKRLPMAMVDVTATKGAMKSVLGKEFKLSARDVANDIKKGLGREYQESGTVLGVKAKTEIEASKLIEGAANKNAKLIVDGIGKINPEVPPVSSRISVAEAAENKKEWAKELKRLQKDPDASPADYIEAIEVNKRSLVEHWEELNKTKDFAREVPDDVYGSGVLTEAPTVVNKYSKLASIVTRLKDRVSHMPEGMQILMKMADLDNETARLEGSALSYFRFGKIFDLRKNKSTLSGFADEIQKIQNDMAFNPNKYGFKNVSEWSGRVGDSRVWLDFKRMPEVEQQHIVDIIEDGVPAKSQLHREMADVVKQGLDDMYSVAQKYAKQEGIKIAPYRKSYFPSRMPDWKIANRIIPELEKIFLEGYDLAIAKKKISDKTGVDNLTYKDLAIIGKILENRKGSVSTRLQEYLDFQKRLQGANFNLGSAIIRGRKTLKDYVYGKSGNLLYSRTNEFPLEWYIKNPYEALTRYIESWAKFVATSKNVGLNLQKIDGLRKRLNERYSLEDISLMENAIDEFFGAKIPEKNSWQSLYSQFQYATKLALSPVSSLKQIPQTLISVLPTVGFKNYLTGLASLANPEVRRAVFRSGILRRDIFRAEVPGITEGMLKMVGDKVGVHFLLPNLMNFYIAGASWLQTLPEWHRIAKSETVNPKLREITRQRLNRIGLDWTKDNFSEAEALESLYRFANDTQMQKSIMNDPAWLNDPNKRWLGIFQRFKIGQGNLQYELLKDAMQGGSKEFARYLFTTLISAQVSGEWIQWASNRMMELTTGKPYYRKDDTMMERFLRNLASSQFFGLWTTFGHSAIRAGEGMVGGVPGATTEAVRTAQREVIPVAFSDVSNVAEEGVRTAIDIDSKRKATDIMRRAFARSMGEVGPLFGVLGEEALTKGQKIASEQQLKGNMKKRLYYLFTNDKAERAIEVLNQWNAAHPEEVILPEDITKVGLEKKQTEMERTRLEAGLRRYGGR